jgi:hypothetical protein
MEPSVEQALCLRLENARTAALSGANWSVRPGGTDCNVRANLAAVVFLIRKWSIEVHDCVMGDSTSRSLVVVLMAGPSILPSFKRLMLAFLIASFPLVSSMNKVEIHFFIVLSHRKSSFLIFALSDTHGNPHFGENFRLLSAFVRLRFHFHSFLHSLLFFQLVVSEFCMDADLGKILLSIRFSVFRFAFPAILLLNTNSDCRRFLH